jgi:DNA-binding response OmpR family regulator
MRLLVIDADPARRNYLERTLSRRGHDATIVATGFDGLRLAVGEPYDAVVLDVALPDVSGSDMLKMLRAVSDVAVVATMTDDESKSGQLNAGADDYLVEPYSADQLEFRLRVVTQRTEEMAIAAETLTVGDLNIDRTARVAYLGTSELSLTRKEFDMLAYMASKVGEVVSKRELAAQVWGDPYGGSDRTVDVHLSWLRRKLGESAAKPRYLRTIRGVGIKLVDPG